MSNADNDEQGARHNILPADLLEKLREIGTARTFPKNAIVVVEGEPAETLYIVLSGRLRVYVADDEGREAELNQMGPGEYFGELMLGSAVRTASVRALEASRLCMIGRADFERFIRSSPETTFHLIQTLIHRIKVLTENVQSLALMDVYGRVAKLFADEAIEEAGQRFVPGMSQQRIGERVGASRSMINRILKDLTTGGYIELSRERIDLLRDLPKRW
ncbi:MAG: Crp/Fnr family transcriptional regulator [Burkholderiaceae bacterium]